MITLNGVTYEQMGDNINPIALVNNPSDAEAGYVNGRWPTYPVIVRDFPSKPTLPIAVNASVLAQCLDDEPGDAVDSQVPGWFRMVLGHGIVGPWVYKSVSGAQALVDLLAQSGFPRNSYILWTAHYTYTPHLCGPQCGFGMRTTADATQYTDRAAAGDVSLLRPGLLPLNRTPIVPAGGPIVPPQIYAGMAATHTGLGYWQSKGDGSIITEGDAQYLGGANWDAQANKPVTLNAPIVGIAAHPSAPGYWQVAADGGVFAYGAAQFHGSLAAVRLAQPAVGIVATPTGNGYWIDAGDGGVFPFGDAAFEGSGVGK